MRLTGLFSFALFVLPLGASLCIPANPIEAYFSETEEITLNFVESRDEYNEIAMRADIVQTNSAYEAQLQAARNRRYVLLANLVELEAVEVSEEVLRYHELNVRLHELSIEWLDAILVAYDIRNSRRMTNEAYDRALRIHDSVEFTKDEMANWLATKGYRQ